MIHVVGNTEYKITFPAASLYAGMVARCEFHFNRNPYNPQVKSTDADKLKYHQDGAELYIWLTEKCGMVEEPDVMLELGRAIYNRIIRGPDTVKILTEADLSKMVTEIVMSEGDVQEKFKLLKDYLDHHRAEMAKLSKVEPEPLAEGDENLNPTQNPTLSET